MCRCGRLFMPVLSVRGPQQVPSGADVSLCKKQVKTFVALLSGLWRHSDLEPGSLELPGEEGGREGKEDVHPPPTTPGELPHLRAALRDAGFWQELGSGYRSKDRLSLISVRLSGADFRGSYLLSCFNLQQVTTCGFCDLLKGLCHSDASGSCSKRGHPIFFPDRSNVPPTTLNLA